MKDADVVQVVLSEREHEEILASQILPAWISGAVAQEQPVTVLVGGPPGSGKSTACQVLKAVLDRRGGSVLIGRDLYKTAHPAYKRLLEQDEPTAGVRVRPDVLRWQAEVEEVVCAGRFDVLVESPVVDADQARAHRAAGRRVEVVVVVESEAVTQLSVLERYLAQVAEDGAGRYVSWENHDQCTRRLLESLEVIEREGIADRVMLVRRDL
ncbi:AAA family ATPase, partial [Streptomyces sp. SID5770]|uniref:zeta toxin family protein n=1 Tax=Streptomyces sp. SID5770 TaxID=2690308 RepID=UPI00136A77C4|nr:AAA family ATPase [Streptomyces sp. SID5770]